MGDNRKTVTMNRSNKNSKHTIKTKAIILSLIIIIVIMTSTKE